MSLTKRIPEVLGLVAALVLAGGCETLNVKNPNAPDSARLLTDPATVQSIAIGAMRTWFSTTQGPTDGADPYPGPTLTVMARSHVAAWNNFNIRFYTGCTDGTSVTGTTLPWTGGAATSLTYTAATLGTCGGTSYGAPYARAAWQNDAASAQRTQIEFLWYGYYSALSAANDVVTAIRKKGLIITDAATTKMVETMGVLVQALCLSQISLMYDKGFVVDENSDLTSLSFSTRAQMRDKAIEKFDDVIKNLTATTFTVAGDFFGKPGQGYDNVAIAQIANTMAARTLAYFPRTAAENVDPSVVNWAKVVSYAKNGISSPTAGTPFDWVFHQDGCINWCDFLKVWTNDMTTMRIHSRVAHLMDPLTQPDPWNLAANSSPHSPDARLGDGTMRAERAGDAYAEAMEVHPDLTGNGGYDYVWSFHQENQNKSRGLWHQSAIGQVRYDSLATCGDDPQGDAAGVGDAPVVLAAENDLIWAEALIRRAAPDAATAATLINYTRVGPDRLGRPRGSLPPSTGTLADLQYEQDVELPGSNIAPYFNQRRIDNLEPLTPHEMPVPAKQLIALQLPLYTWGGANNPPNSSPTATAAGLVASAQNAARVWADLRRQARAELNARLHRRQ